MGVFSRFFGLQRFWPIVKQHLKYFTVLRKSEISEILLTARGDRTFRGDTISILPVLLELLEISCNYFNLCSGIIIPAYFSDLFGEIPVNCNKIQHARTLELFEICCYYSISTYNFGEIVLCNLLELIITALLSCCNLLELFVFIISLLYLFVIINTAGIRTVIIITVSL